MARKISHWATAVAASATIAVGGLLAAVAPAMPSSAHTYGEEYNSGWAADAGGSQYSDGYSWYRLDYGLLYRWDGGSWVAQPADDTGLTQSLDYRYDNGHLYHWNGTQWILGTGRPDDITQSLSLNPDPQIAEQA